MALALRRVRWPGPPSCPPGRVEGGERPGPEGGWGLLSRPREERAGRRPRVCGGAECELELKDPEALDPGKWERVALPRCPLDRKVDGPSPPPLSVPFLKRPVQVSFPPFERKKGVRI